MKNNPRIPQTHYVVCFHHIDDDRCMRPLEEALHEPPYFGHPPAKEAFDRAMELSMLIGDLAAYFRAHGWEGDGTIECMFLAPCFVDGGHGNCQVIYHVKQANNGTSFLAIPHGMKLATAIGDKGNVMPRRAAQPPRKLPRPSPAAVLKFADRMLRRVRKDRTNKRTLGQITDRQASEDIALAQELHRIAKAHVLGEAPLS